MGFVHFALISTLLVSWAAAQEAIAATETPVQDTSFSLAPIASAAPDSSSFALASDLNCDASVVTTLYELYARNTMVFQTCVAEGHYRVFPFSGTHATPEQIGAMAQSPACRALFTAFLMAGCPECDIANFPMRAAAETVLKIAVDMDTHPTAVNTVPSTERFVQMMMWRRDVNLAEAAGIPCDSASQLYAEFAANLQVATTNGLVRLTENMLIEYRSSVDGSFSQSAITSEPNIPGMGSSGSINATVAVFAEEASAGSASTIGSVTYANTKDATSGSNARSPEAATNQVPVSEGSSSAAGLRGWSTARATALAATVAMVILA
ncbi:hypothetical protein BBJ28_00007578 [Nothophytophthora sp. Chile5]|nr:hypothetical protein BBJ28_00007578 [Nothophytophthora sp. Chile5]